MLFETLIMKRTFLFVLSFLALATEFSCRSISVQKNEFKNETVVNVPQDNVEFSEVRRLNRDVQLSEYMILKNFDETLKLYAQLEDKRFSRSEPIPALEENEFFLMMKPKMKSELFGDIEVMKIEMKNSVLNVYFKEISNQEYLSNKQKNPILILRIKGKAPSGIKMITVNK